jgi:hypothetical protein
LRGQGSEAGYNNQDRGKDSHGFSASSWFHQRYFDGK